jgi:hypothetical protein
MNSASQPFTLEAKVQRPSQCKTPTWQYLFTKATTSQRKLGLDMHGNLWTPKLWSRGCQYFFIKNKKTDKILAARLEGLFWEGTNMGCLFFFWTLGLAFGGFTLCPTKGSNSYILLAIFTPFLWTLNKVWPFNPMASRPR